MIACADNNPVLGFETRSHFATKGLKSLARGSVGRSSFFSQHLPAYRGGAEPQFDQGFRYDDASSGRCLAVKP